MYDDLPKRKNIRLKEFDYSQNGAYFITICTQDRLNLFGNIVGADLVSARMRLNPAGQMTEKLFIETINNFKDIASDKYIIMPNHFHCIITISRADTRSAPTQSVSGVIQAFKSKTTVEYINGVKAGWFQPFNKRIWQHRFHDHIIRNEEEYQKTWEYIDKNPARWAEDCYYSGK